MSKDNDHLSGLGFNVEQFSQALFGSFDLMSKTWQGVAQNSPVLPFGKAPLTLEELDKRIEELKHVESWLKINLSMLSNSIQALEMQRTGLASFKNIVQTVSDHHKNTPSLEEVLNAFSPKAEPTPAETQEDQMKHSPVLDKALNASATAWWDLLQQQLNNIAASQDQSLQQSIDKAQLHKAEQTTPTKLKRSSKPAAKKLVQTAPETAKTAKPSAVDATKPARTSTAKKTTRARRVTTKPASK